MKACITALLLCILQLNIAEAQNPTYALDVNDRTFFANWVEFDIDMTWTNAGVAPNFEYRGGQYFFDINSAISNGGVMSLSIVASDLPVNMRPRNPTVYTVTTPAQLRLAINTAPGPGNGFQMAANEQVKIVRLRLTTSAFIFSETPLDLGWRNGISNPYTKIYAYVGTTGTDISTPNTHTISIPNTPIPNWQGVTLYEPENSGGYYNQPVTFKWGQVSGASNYHLYISSNSFSIVDTISNDTSALVYFPVEEDSSTIRWRVVGADGSNQPFAISGVDSFVVRFPVISLSTPINGTVFPQQPVTFKWHRSEVAVKYLLQLSKSPAMQNVVFSDSTLTDTTTTINYTYGLDTVYYWRVIGKDAQNNSVSVSEIRSFTPRYSIYLDVKCTVQAMLNPIPGKMNRTDTFTVYLRNNYGPYDIIDSASAPVDSSTLTGKFKFKYAMPGTYYIVVKHFNSIETWSKAGGEQFWIYNQHFYDFTLASSQAYGNNMRLRAGKYCFHSGDVNQSGFIEGTDFMRVANAAYDFEVGIRVPEDLDASGLVDATDFSIVDNNSLLFIGTVSPLTESLKMDDRKK